MNLATSQVRHPTQFGNPIRTHITEIGFIAAKGTQIVDRMRKQLG